MESNHAWMGDVARDSRRAAKQNGRHQFEAEYVPSLPERQRAFAMEKIRAYAARYEREKSFTEATWLDRPHQQRPYHRAGLVSIADVVANVGKHVTVNGVPATCNSWRIHLYATKGTKCVRCGLEGTTFAIERSKGQMTNKHHLNLYHVTKSGREIMMTVDHIIPKSLGGGNEMSNLQPMCIHCNGRKGNKIEGQGEAA